MEFPCAVWHDACAAAHIPGRRWLHDFRRTAARHYRRSGVSEGVVMKILGHKTRSIFERHNIKNEDDLREAAQAVAVMGQNGANGAQIVPLAPSAPARESGLIPLKRKVAEKGWSRTIRRARGTPGRF